MKLHVHPDYKYLTPLLRGIPNGEYKCEKVFCNERNIVELTTFLGRKYVIKRYKRPTLFNCLMYTFFRKSKARRAYDYALLLMERGINTPFPVAYIEEKKWGIFCTGYFVSEYLPYSTLRDLKVADLSVEEHKKLVQDIISYTIELNDKKVLPLDFNPGNIFCYRKDNDRHWRFALTDVNRMQFGKMVGFNDTMRAFAQFGITTDKIYKVMVEYSLQKNIDIDFAMFVFLFYRIRRRSVSVMKRKVRSVLHKEHAI